MNRSVERIVVAESARRGIGRRKIPPTEMLDRVILPMVNEGDSEPVEVHGPPSTEYS